MTNNIILSDFDGTITTINVLDSLYEEFGGPSYRFYMERWIRGEISTMEEIEQIFTPNFRILELKTTEITGKYGPHLAVVALLERN